MKSYWDGMTHYATNRKIKGLIPDEVIGFVQFTYSFPFCYTPLQSSPLPTELLGV
jgi:hypothetical protein